MLLFYAIPLLHCHARGECLRPAEVPTLPSVIGLRRAEALLMLLIYAIPLLHCHARGECLRPALRTRRGPRGLGQRVTESATVRTRPLARGEGQPDLLLRGEGRINNFGCCNRFGTGGIWLRTRLRLGLGPKEWPPRSFSQRLFGTQESGAHDYLAGLVVYAVPLSGLEQC